MGAPVEGKSPISDACRLGGKNPIRLCHYCKSAVALDNAGGCPNCGAPRTVNDTHIAVLGSGESVPFWLTEKTNVSH